MTSEIDTTLLSDEEFEAWYLGMSLNELKKLRSNHYSFIDVPEEPLPVRKKFGNKYVKFLD